MEEQTPIKRKGSFRWLLVISVLVALLLLFLFGWIPRIKNSQKIEALAAQRPLPQVNILEVKPNTKPIELVLPSSAQAWHITPIWARANGYLIRYLVDIGDMVREGDLLAELDTPEIDQQVEQAQADLLNSMAERNIAKITNDRWQGLWNKNREAVSKQEVDQYGSNYKSADALVLANEKNVARLTYQKNFKYIYAPFDGIITQRTVDVGALVYGNVNGNPQELFQIAQTHTIRFFVDVPQNYFRNIKEGLEAEVTVKEFPDQIFKGVVTRYAKALDPIARTLLTEVDVENPQGILYAGLFGRVKFLMKPDTVNFIIPSAALIIRAGYPHVAIVDKDNIVHVQQVQIGRDYGKQVEIIEGLQENDRVVTLPSDQLSEGTQVEIIPTENKT